MRTLYAEGKLSGAAAELMQPLPYEQLYDTEADPHEINNLIDSQDPEVIKVLEEMRTALDKWVVETGDKGEIAEARDVVAPFEQEMHDWFGTPEWYQMEISDL